MNKTTERSSKAIIFDAINQAAPTVTSEPEDIDKEALALLDESQYARPALLSENLCEAFIQRIESGLVIGTSCEVAPSLNQLPIIVKKYLSRYQLANKIAVQKTPQLSRIDWGDIQINQDIMQDQSIGLCWAEYGIAETGSLVIHSSPYMPILLNFLPLYQLMVIAKSSILPFLDDYGAIANRIAKQQNTPRNICLITGASGTTDIEGVLVQGAHGPEFLHIIIVDNL